MVMNERIRCILGINASLFCPALNQRVARDTQKVGPRFDIARSFLLFVIGTGGVEGVERR